MECKLIPSICSYCGTGCGVLFKVIDGELVGTLPLKTHPVSQGKLCIKGWNLHEHINSFLRLKSPLIKENGMLRKCDWHTAINATAEALKTTIERYGPDSVGVLVSAKITNEENYLAQKFARAALGTNNIDNCARL